MKQPSQKVQPSHPDLFHLSWTNSTGAAWMIRDAYFSLKPSFNIWNNGIIWFQSSHSSEYFLKWFQSFQWFSHTFSHQTLYYYDATSEKWSNMIQLIAINRTNHVLLLPSSSHGISQICHGGFDGFVLGCVRWVLKPQILVICVDIRLSNYCQWF